MPIPIIVSVMILIILGILYSMNRMVKSIENDYSSARRITKRFVKRTQRVLK